MISARVANVLSAEVASKSGSARDTALMAAGAVLGAVRAPPLAYRRVAEPRTCELEVAALCAYTRAVP